MHGGAGRPARPTEADMLLAVTLVRPSDGSKGKAVSAVAKQMNGKEITRDNLTAALKQIACSRSPSSLL